jgi:hypothetical protein
MDLGIALLRAAMFAVLYAGIAGAALVLLGVAA